MKKIVSIITVIALVFATLTGCMSYDEEFYSPENRTIELSFLFDDSAALPSNAVIPDQNHSQVSTAGSDQPTPAEEYYIYDGDELEIIKVQVAAFFKETYDVSVEDKLDLIETRIFEDFGTFSIFERTNGYSIPGENIIYLNSYVTEGSLDRLAYTWVHEAIHAIGLDYFNPEYRGLYEAITEAVNHQFFDWAGYKVGSSSYRSIIPVGDMIITANPDIVANSIINENFLIEDEIDKVLSNATYTQQVIAEGHSVAYQLNCCLFCFYDPTVIDPEMLFYIGEAELFDHITRTIREVSVAYCRTFGLTKRQIRQFNKIWESEDYTL